TQDPNIHAGTQADSDSECNEQVIVVPSFPSNRFSSPTVHEASEMMESYSDYAEELVRLQRQEHEANDTTEKYGFGFSKDTEEHLRQADIEARRNMVPADSIDPAASISVVPAKPFPTVIEPAPAADTSLPPGIVNALLFLMTLSHQSGFIPYYYTSGISFVLQNPFCPNSNFPIWQRYKLPYLLINKLLQLLLHSLNPIRIIKSLGNTTWFKLG
ncbi:hypothetical protein Tco_1559436, partial [Tanacetum coccineum]